MSHFVVLGQGNSSANVIEDGLADLPKDSTFHIYTYKTSDEGVCRAYDWLLDNKATYVAYHNNASPQVLLNSAAKVVETDSPIEEMVEVAKSLKATVLYLWDDTNEKRSEEGVTTLIDMGLRVLDLTQGLTPFMLVDEKKEVNDTVDSLPPVSREEYLEMSDAVVKQHAKAHGIDASMKATKEELIDALCGESDTKEGSDERAATVIVVLNEHTTKVFKVTEHRAQELLKQLK